MTERLSDERLQQLASSGLVGEAQAMAAGSGQPLPHETLLPFQVHAAEQGR